MLTLVTPPAFLTQWGHGMMNPSGCNPAMMSGPWGTAMGTLSVLVLIATTAALVALTIFLMRRNRYDRRT